MRAMDNLSLLHLPDYTAATIGSALTILSKGWVEVESCEAASLTSLLEMLQVGSQVGIFFLCITVSVLEQMTSWRQQRHGEERRRGEEGVEVFSYDL